MLNDQNAMFNVNVSFLDKNNNVLFLDEMWNTQFRKKKITKPCIQIINIHSHFDKFWQCVNSKSAVGTFFGGKTFFTQKHVQKKKKNLEFDDKQRNHFEQKISHRLFMCKIHKRSFCEVMWLHAEWRWSNYNKIIK